MKKFLVIAGIWLLSSIAAAAQGACPSFSFGLVLTPAQWQACFDAKQNSFGYTPVNKAGDTMSGLLTMATTAAGGAGLNVPPGTAPTSPNNGDVWFTTTGAFLRANGVTVGPLTGSSGGTVSLGTVSSGITPLTCVKGPNQTMTNAGASTILLVPLDGQCSLQVINGNAAGSITLTGNSATPSTGDAFTTALTKSATVTISNAAPAVVTWTAHGLLGNAMVFLSTTGTLPNPLAVNTIYYVVLSTITANTFQLSATPGGFAINTNTNGAGTHTGKQPSVFLLQDTTIAGLATAVWKKQQ